MRRLLLVLCAVALVGCESSDEPLTIFAASSLTEAFTAIDAAFRAEHPGVRTEFNFAGSQALRTQIEHGAPADLFASANPTHIDDLVDAGLVETPRPLARNTLAVAVAADSAIRSFDDLPAAERVVLGSERVPVGMYTERLLERVERQRGAAWVEEVRDAVVSRESNVRLVLSRVAMGEADAAIVYRSDAIVDDDAVRFIDVPGSVNVAATYQVARVERSGASESAAESWLRFVGTPQATRILGEHGFTPTGAR